MLAAICVFLINSEFDIRLGLFTVTNLIALMPLLILKPYKDWKMNVMEILIELCFFIISILMLMTGGKEYDWKETWMFLVSFATGILV